MNHLIKCFITPINGRKSMGSWGETTLLKKREVLLPAALLGFLCVGVSQFVRFQVADFCKLVHLGRGWLYT